MSGEQNRSNRLLLSDLQAKGSNNGLPICTNDALLTFICTPQTLAASRRRTSTRSTDVNFHDANLYRSRVTPKHRSDWREDCTKVSAFSALTCRREADTLCLPIGRWHVPSGLGEKFHADKRRFESRHCDCAVRQRAERRTVQLMRQAPSAAQSFTFVFENLRSNR